MKLKPEVKEKWLAALRSGEYRQAKGALRRPGYTAEGAASESFCCLGVLCEVAMAEGVALRRVDKWGENGYEGTGDDYTGIVDAYPPGVVTRWAVQSGLDGADLGLDVEDDNLWDEPVAVIDADDESGGRFTSLVGMNDNGRSFDDIADVIEREL